jgi:hypothetical protein
MLSKRSQQTVAEAAQPLAEAAQPLSEAARIVAAIQSREEHNGCRRSWDPKFLQSRHAWRPSGALPNPAVQPLAANLQMIWVPSPNFNPDVNKKHSNSQVQSMISL